MKLRIRGNSVRLRLLRGEVRQLSEIGRVAETIHFGLSSAESLTYALEASASVNEMNVKFANNNLIISLPDKIAREWIESEQIGLSGEQNFGSINGETEAKILKILIEKDFVCLDRVDDVDNSDAYPHPNKPRC